MKHAGIFVLLLSLLFSSSFLFAESAQDLQLKQTLEEAFTNSNEIHARFDDNFFWDETSNVHVLVENGIVTLKGIVTTYEAKKGFIKIAQQTPGVQEVVEKIRVIPSPRKVD